MNNIEEPSDDDVKLTLAEVFNDMTPVQILAELCLGVVILSRKIDLPVGNVLKMIYEAHSEYEDEVELETDSAFDRALNMLDSDKDLTIEDLFGNLE